MFRTVLINFGLRLIDKYLVSKIKLEELRLYVVSLLEPLEKVAGILTDKNPENTSQLREFWAEQKENIIGDSLEAAAVIIEKEVEDELTRDLILELIKTYREEEEFKKKNIIITRRVITK